jgi:hypothetical protein
LQSAGDPKAVLTDIALGAFAASLAPLAKFMNDKNITNFAELRAAVFDHFKKPGCGSATPPGDELNPLCFIAGTPVLTTDGSVPIEDTDIGESVCATARG